MVNTLTLSVTGRNSALGDWFHSIQARTELAYMIDACALKAQVANCATKFASRAFRDKRQGVSEY
jgi:hypothetical protein